MEGVIKAEEYEKYLKTSAILLGYKRLPVSIRRFVTDDYYLGKTFGNDQLFPTWLEELEKVFPSPIHTSSTIIVLTGAIGTGKSTFTKIAALYNMHRLDCLKNIYKSLAIARGKRIKFSFQHRTLDLAAVDFIDSINDIRGESPYFNGDFTLDDNIILAPEGERANKTIGSDVLFYALSELNFINPETAAYKLDQAFKRWDSRFFPIKGYFGNIIVDTSSRGDNSITDNFIKECPYPDLKVTRISIWEAKKHLGIYGKAGWFQVYAGDSTHSPFIVDEKHKITDEMDQSRVLKVPEELRPHFISNITAALQDQAGYSTVSVGRLVEDPDRAKKQFIKPLKGPQIINVDFYNKSEKLLYYFDRYLRDIPDNKVIFPRVDIGLVNDKLGLAITYFDKFLFPTNSTLVKIPTYVTPLMVAMGRYADQETSIYHIFDFILDLSQRFEIGDFSADQFASAQLLQDLRREKIPVSRISVDLTDQPYIYFKNQVMNGYWKGVNHPLAIKEFCSLRVVGNKIDHPASFDDGSKGSKDIMDAVCGSVWDCYQNLEKATVYSSKNLIENQIGYLQRSIGDTAMTDFVSQQMFME